MKVKNRNILELVLRIIILGALFIPFYVGYRYWQYEPSLTYHGIKALKDTENLSWFSIINLGGILFIIVLILGIVFSILQLLGKGKKSNNKLVAVISVLELLTFLVSAVMTLTYTLDTEYWYQDIVPNTGFFMLSILIIVSTVLCVVGYIHAKKQGIIDEEPLKQDSNNFSSNIEDLKKLLDNGLITQEEYDAKKKQILGL